MNTVLLIVVIVLLAVPVSLLFLPVVLTIDTHQDKYAIAVSGIGSMRLIWVEELPRIQLRLPFFTRDFDPFSKPEKKKNKKAAEKPEPPDESRKGPKMTPAKAMAMLRSFRVRRFRLSLDTGDYVQNAMLVPVMQLGQNRGLDVSVNFTGSNILILVISNNLWRIGRAYLMTN